MTVFGRYARYYDLLYRDKEYQVEADFVAGLVRSHAPGASSLLELGCGTGRHAGLLAGAGYQVHGVDRSPEMLSDAQRRRDLLPGEAAERLSFSCGDLRELRLERSFEVVISLFHVMSYMSANDDLARAFATARAHLAPGGLFLFDCWYGPAVLSDPPVVRVKRLADDQVEITRIAEPKLFPNENCVEVNYEVQVRDRGSQSVDILRESHRMRYLFLPEIEALFASHGMKGVYCGEWLTGQEPGTATWNVCVAGRVELS